MKRLNRRIFVNFFLITSILLLVSMFVCVPVIYNTLSDQNDQELTEELGYVETGYDQGGTAYLKALESNRRITLIKADGTVLFDNESDVSAMENHGDREEVKEALESGIGYSERFSQTLSEKTIYVAKLMGDGNVLRISDTTDTVWKILFESLVPLGILIGLAIVTVLLVSLRTSRSITKPINEIDLSNPDKNAVYEELDPLVDRLVQQNALIREQVMQLKEEHKKQDSMRRDFTANVSHELKTPLTSISGFAEIIEYGIAREDDIPRFAGKIHGEAQRMITLVGDIIKLSQMEDDNMPVKRESVDLYDTCAAVISQLEDAAFRNNVTVSLEGPNCSINTVEQVVDEIIYNLIDNGIKYNKDGGHVWVSISNKDGQASVTVRDDGIGMEEKELERIFERFYRVDKSRSKAIGGTGLGLSIVKHGASSIGAKIEIQSKIDKGTVIVVKF